MGSRLIISSTRSCRLELIFSLTLISLVFCLIPFLHGVSGGRRVTPGGAPAPTRGARRHREASALLSLRSEASACRTYAAGGHATPLQTQLLAV